MKNTQLKEQLKNSFIKTILSVKHSVEPTPQVTKTIFEMRNRFESNQPVIKVQQIKR